MTASSLGSFPPPSLASAQAVAQALKALLCEAGTLAAPALAAHPTFAAWCDALERFHNDWGTLSLGVAPSHFWFDDWPWAESEDAPSLPDEAPSLSTRLFFDGVRCLTFSPAMPENERLRLGVVLGEWWHRRSSVALLTSLWRPSWEGFSCTEADPLDVPSQQEDWPLDEVVRGLYELQESHPRQQWNFTPRGYQPQDATTQEREVSDSLDELVGETLSLDEKETLQEILAQEEAQLPLRSSDLFLLVLMHCKEPSDIEPLQSWLEPIASSLLQSEQWSGLSLLLEDLERMVEQLAASLLPEGQRLVEELWMFLCQPAQLAPLSWRLMQWERLPNDDRHGLRSYLSLLVAHCPSVLDELAGANSLRQHQELWALLERKRASVSRLREESLS